MSERKKENSQNAPTLMTAETHKRLQAELESARSALNSAQMAIGEAAGPEGAWHDNAAYDQALVDAGVRGATVARLLNALSSVQYIEPRKETHNVGIGNSVQVLFTGEEATEIYLILGQFDSDPMRNIISYDSPLGGALMGKLVGSTVNYNVGQNKIQLKIEGIYPGNF